MPQAQWILDSDNPHPQKSNTILPTTSPSKSECDPSGLDCPRLAVMTEKTLMSQWAEQLPLMLT